MNNWYEFTQKENFWNTAFKITTLVLLVLILLSTLSLSHSFKRGGHKGGESMKWGKMEGKDKKDMGKDMTDIKKESVKLPEDGKKVEVLDMKMVEKTVTATGETKEKENGWWFFGNSGSESKKEAATITVETQKTPDPENRYNFRCDAGNILKVYEGKYLLKGQKSSLEPGKIAVEDPQTGRIHFLAKKEVGNGKAVYDKVVESEEKGGKVSYTYTFTTLSTGAATFTKNGTPIYTNCSLVR